MSLILASRSPRRQQLLAALGLKFEVVAADVVEDAKENEEPEEMTLRLAESKARQVCRVVGKGCRVIGGDTVVALDGKIMGKPQNREHAMAMLTELSGRTHRVLSAVALIEDSHCRKRLSESRVTFARLTRQQITRYCDTRDPYDKAGAYGIQGEAGHFVTELAGSYSGVVGLPLWHLHQLLFEPAKS